MHARVVPGTGVRVAVSSDRGGLVPALRVESDAPSPVVGTPGTHSWRSRTGQLVAHGGRNQYGCWMTWPHLATYYFSPDQPDIVAHAEPDAALEVVWDTYRRSVLPMAMQARGCEALHASAVECAHGIVAFCAVSETGKSSVAYGLARRGFAQWSDDAVVLASEDPTMTVPLPFEVRLRESAKGILDGSLPRPKRLTRNDRGDQRHHLATKLHAICVLERQAGAAQPLTERIEPATAFRALLTHAHEFNPHDAVRRAVMLERYLSVSGNVPIYRISFEAKPQSFSPLLEHIIGTLSLEPAFDAATA